MSHPLASDLVSAEMGLGDKGVYFTFLSIFVYV